MVHRRKVRGPRNSVVDPPRSFASTEPFGGFETFVNVLGISTDAWGGVGIYREGTHMARDEGASRKGEEERADGPEDCLACAPLAF
jgi:hypothetical protein